VAEVELSEPPPVSVKSGSEREPVLTVLTDLEGELSFLPFDLVACFVSTASVPDLLELLTVEVDF
jgi:hypothetical protein